MGRHGHSAEQIIGKLVAEGKQVRFRATFVAKLLRASDGTS